MATAPPQDFTAPRGPHPGRTALATTTATRRDSPGKSSSEASPRILTKVSLTYFLYLTARVDMIIADEITASFRRFGPLVVDWPHKAESKSYFPPKGYAFLLFQVGEMYLFVDQRSEIRDQRSELIDWTAPVAGRELGAAADRGVYPGRGQAVPLCQLPNNQRQTGPDPTLEAERRRLCAGRHTTSRPQENCIRRWSASTSESW